MKIVSIIARILLGLTFTVFGLNGFLLFLPSPHFPPGYLMDFFTAMRGSGFYVLVFGVQVIVGILFLTNLYVPLAIVVSGAVLANILTFHATMNPQGFPPALIAVICWFLTAWPIRAQFAPIFARKAAAP